jgi:peptidyl-dipeptidase A
MKRLFGLITTVILFSGFSGFVSADAVKADKTQTEEMKPVKEEVAVEQQTKARTFLDKYNAEVEKILVTQAISYWQAANSGKTADFDAYAAADLEMKKLHSDPARFAVVEGLLPQQAHLDTLTVRSLQVAELAFKENQLPKTILEKMTKMAAEIEQAFNTYRGQLEGKKYSNNDLEDLLKTETDSARRQKIWETLKQVGETVAPRLKALAKIRNEAARQVGYKNFWDMKIRLQEHNPEELISLFNQLEKLTDEPFKQMKAKMDRELAAKFKISVEEMMPWHYDNPFFQEAPPSDKVNLDEFYKDKKKEEIVEIAKKFYRDIGLPIGDIVKRSDLYERAGKQPHAFCISINRRDDIRALLNIKPNAYWMDTVLHEMGHAVYDKYIDKSLPFILRDPAHTFTTEAVAMLFGALAKNPLWITNYARAAEKRVKEVEKPILEQRRREQLIFCRWTLVMLNFEKSFYENPDRDLNTLWWDMVERFQLLKRPRGRNQADWAAKIHFSIAPVYYHNYMMGELLAAQMRAVLVKLAHHTGPAYNLNYAKHKEFGNFFREKIFKPGATLPWPQFVKEATGEPLTASYFAAEVK